VWGRPERSQELQAVPLLRFSATLVLPNKDRYVPVKPTVCFSCREISDPYKFVFTKCFVSAHNLNVLKAFKFKMFSFGRDI
jgi:hypothetical protein